jgi:hypothetical protein
LGGEPDLEYDGVDVLSEEVEEEPVPHVALTDDRVDTLLLHAPAHKPTLAHVLFVYPLFRRKKIFFSFSGNKNTSFPFFNMSNAIDELFFCFL